jgi:hypothetical protein
MSDHEFEKQVHRKMEELRLRPSDTVWMEVEKNIRQDKRRRRFLWLWVPMLLICLTAGGYLLFRSTFNSNNTPAGMAQAVPVSSTNTTITESNNNSTSTKQTTTNTNTTRGSSTIPQASDNTVAGALPQTGSKQPLVTTPDATPGTTITLSNKQQPAIAVTQRNTPVNKETIGINHKIRVKKPQASDDYETSVVTDLTDDGYSHEKQFNGKKRTAKTVYANAVTDSGQQEPESLTTAMPAIVQSENGAIATSKAVPVPFPNQPLTLAPDSTNAQTAAMDIPRKRTSLWHWGIVTDAGFSRISENKLLQLKGLLGEKYLAEDLAANSDRNLSNTTNQSSSYISFAGTSNNAAAPKKAASPIQPDFSFSAGFFVQRTLSPRFKLSLGLQYSYLSVNTQVGKREDNPIVVNIGTSSAAVVPYYYKGVGKDGSIQTADQTTNYSQKYRYRFQYIEIPLMATWQINKGISMPPIVFEGGVSLARLLSVDALHYEGIKGVYYEDNGLFNKTQFNFMAGLSIGLLQRSKHPIWIGPDLRYSLNGLVNKGVSSGQYLWSTGIRIKMMLGRF